MKICFFFGAQGPLSLWGHHPWISTIYMGVSKNRGFPPNSSNFSRVFICFHHPFWGFPPIFGGPPPRQRGHRAPHSDPLLQSRVHRILEESGHLEIPAYSEDTLQGTNISPKNGILKMIFLFPRWDMLISWRIFTNIWMDLMTTSIFG